VGLITLDAHFDLRDTSDGPRNGNPIRCLLEDGLPGRNICQIGIAPFANTAAMHATADEAGIEGGEDEEIEGISVPLGDVVTEIGGKPISSPDDLIEVVNSSEPGDELVLTVVTPAEEPRRVEVRVGVRPDGA